MICIDIKVRNGYNNYLSKLFSGVDLSNYVYEIHDDEIIYSENGKNIENFFGADILNAEEFIKCISRENYYMIFADVKMYPLDKERIKIKIFEDFWNSNCETVLLCTDCAYIEFYSKSKDILDKVYNNCKGSEFEKVVLRSFEDVSGRNFIAF